MNIKDYIASGIVESYVMGLATEAERSEFEQLCTRYPELVAERRQFEESLESHATRHAEAPPDEVRAKIFAALAGMKPEALSSDSPNRAASASMENRNFRGSLAWLRTVAAAAVILLVVMVVLYIRQSRQNADLANENSRLKETVDTNQRLIEKIRQETAVVSNPNSIVVNMTGTKIAPQSRANVYWDSTSSSVYLVVKNMPRLPSDRQYQLWALIDKGQKDLGVFDGTDSAGANVILKMNDTKRAQAFAITIEKKGGSPHPTLDSLQSVGKTELTQ
ncbi:MAG TPA: anti-sigma factor [Puia sp.]|nr:anti-sigma factor [Puia sp.]